MRPRTLFAGTALTAALALLALPGLAGSASPSSPRSPEAAAFQSVLVEARQGPSAQADASAGDGAPGVGSVASDAVFPEPALTTADPLPTRPDVALPGAHGGFDWKPPRYSVTGVATFYDHGTTAMRLPAGTVIRVCGDGGCLELVVGDFGPFGEGRIIDLHRPDFFEICGCASWSGTARVTVHVY